MAQWITSVTFDDEYTTASNQYASDTVQWFFEDNTFQEWIQGKHSIVWCFGHPGVGKTVLSTRIIKHLQTIFDGQNVLVLFVFCHHHRRHDIPTLLAALLRQLVHRSVRSQRLFDMWKSRLPLDREQVVSALRAEITTYDTVFFVVDALDELRSQLQSELINILRGLSPHALVTSRPTIGQLLEKYPKMNISSHRDDLCRYVHGRLVKAPPELERAVKKLTIEYVVEQVVSKADGMFLMARLHVDALESCLTVSQVKETLQTLPSALHERYTGTLERIEPAHRALAFEMFSWVIASAIPLTMDALRCALAAPRSESAIDEDVLLSPEAILVLSVGLVSVSEESSPPFIPRCGIVTLVHYTFEDHLRRRNDLLPPETMTSTCLKYLAFPTSIPYPYPSFFPELHLHFTLPAAMTLPSLLRQVEKISEFESSFDPRILNFLGLLMSGASWRSDSRSPANEIALIHFAAYHNLSNVIGYLLQEGRDPAKRDTIGRTPLAYAARAGNVETMKLLLAHPSVEVNSVDIAGDSPVSLAASSRCNEAVELLLSAGSDPNMRNHDGKTPLSHATSGKMVNTLLAAGVNVNSQDKDGRTALSLAVLKERSVDVVDALLAAPGVDVNLADEAGDTPLSLAAELDQRGDAFKSLLIVSPVNSRDIYGKTPLSRAAMKGRLHSVCSLLKVPGIEVNLRDNDGGTALLRAATENQTEIVKILINTPGVDIDPSDHEGRTPLAHAAIRGCVGTVKVLLNTPGIDHNSRGQDGRTPLHHAALHSSLHSLRLIMASKTVDINSQDHDGRESLGLV